MIYEGLKTVSEVKDGKPVVVFTAFPFDSRDTYRTFVQRWKQEYRHLSGSSRLAKSGTATLMREGKYAGAHQQLVRSLAADARMMLALRAQAKVESHRQWCAHRAVVNGELADIKLDVARQNKEAASGTATHWGVGQPA